MATAESRLCKGDCVTFDYTPDAAVTAGAVVVQTDLIGVAPHDIAASALGSLQAVGPGGVWIFPKSSGTGTALTVGTVVYWDDTSDVATSTASTHKVLGKVVEAASASATEVKVMGIQQATP